MIIISPWSRKTTDGRPSPKNYPFWAEVVKAFPGQIHQVSCTGEPDIPSCQLRSNDLKLSQIEELIRSCETWVSVDNMTHHLAWSIKKPGIVIFGPSDPNIFGHPENINLLKDRKFLRSRQFGLWAEDQWQHEIFVPPQEVVAAINYRLTH
jgi:ADP-heptose:LPS heptosyltransferase